MGLKWYRQSLMAFIYYLGIDDRISANWLCSILLPVLPADHVIPISAPSTEMGVMLPPPTPPTRRMKTESNRNIVEELWIFMAEEESGDGINTPAK